MRQFKVPGQAAPQAGFSKGEKRKLMAMSLGSLLVIAGIVYSLGRQDAYRRTERAELPNEEATLQETVHVPEIDVARLESLTRDGEALERVVLEGEALDALLPDVRMLTSRHFDVMGAAELDATMVDAILADPAAHRADAFVARGSIDSIRQRRRTATGPLEHIGRLRLEDDSVCYFLTLDVPEGAHDTGGFVRVDGLFLKVFSDEDALNPGSWIDGPLLIGARAARAYRDLGAVTAPPLAVLNDVEDAALSPSDGSEARIVRDTPFEPLWSLMAYARDVDPASVDWDAAPELDYDFMSQLMEHPEPWRAQPVRIPISRIQDARVKLAGENPARIERYTEGWIGNWNWPNVLHFKSPHPDFDIRLRDYATAQGFFLHNFAYDSAGKSLRIAPLFVLTSLTRFEHEKDPIWGKLAVGFVSFTILLGVTFATLLSRDDRRAKELQGELVRRRRARRAASGRKVEPLNP